MENELPHCDLDNARVVQAWETKSAAERAAATAAEEASFAKDGTSIAEGMDGMELMSSRDIQAAVNLEIGGELAKHAVFESTKAVTKYTAGGRTGQMTQQRPPPGPRPGCSSRSSWSAR